MTDSTLLPRLLSHVDADAKGAEARLIEWLRIPSISAQAAHAGDCRRAAEWFRDQLRGLGFTAEVEETAGQPCVVASHPGNGHASSGAKSRPHLLYYGHYDVQPADPLDLWHSPPFEPTLVQGPNGPRIVARGAVDDKGQTVMWLEALRAWHAVAGGPPLPITILLEGEEEIGSPSLDPFLEKNAARLKADAAIVSDTGMWDIDTPALTTRLRGLVYTQIDLYGPKRDLHSGIFGGGALNPINLLTRVLGDLQDKDGRIQIPGFYDDVIEPPEAQKQAWAALGFDEAEFLGEIGLSEPVGEKGVSALERLWARPTADLNGIWGGYTGQGSKTVIAAEAHAKLSFRLVPGQKPEKVLAGLKEFLAARIPADARVEVQNFGMASAIEIPQESPFVQAAQTVLSEEYGRPAVLIGGGGSIPVVESMRRILGVDALLMGFGLDDDQVHSPNEKFDLRCFHHGIRSHARLLAKLAE